VKTFFEKLDFRRFQVDFNEPGEIPRLIEYGDKLWEKILNDQVDTVIIVENCRMQRDIKFEGR